MTCVVTTKSKKQSLILSFSFSLIFSLGSYPLFHSRSGGAPTIFRPISKQIQLSPQIYTHSPSSKIKKPNHNCTIHRPFYFLNRPLPTFRRPSTSVIPEKCLRCLTFSLEYYLYFNLFSTCCCLDFSLFI